MSHIKDQGSAQLFKNPILEFLTRSPAWFSASVYISVAIGQLYVAWAWKVVDSLATGAAVFAGAILFWTFFEYLWHRYLNHVDEYFPESKFAKWFAYTIHGVHHEFPRDKDRLIMPPVPGMTMYLIVISGYWLVMGKIALVFVPGFMTGYLTYTYIHYKTHQTRVPGWLKAHYRHHALHHYKYPDKAFGVSTMFWDRVFGTMPPDAKVPAPGSKSVH